MRYTVAASKPGHLKTIPFPILANRNECTFGGPAAAPKSVEPPPSSFQPWPRRVPIGPGSIQIECWNNWQTGRPKNSGPWTSKNRQGRPPSIATCWRSQSPPHSQSQTNFAIPWWDWPRRGQWLVSGFQILLPSYSIRASQRLQWAHSESEIPPPRVSAIAGHTWPPACLQSERLCKRPHQSRFPERLPDWRRERPIPQCNPPRRPGRRASCTNWCRQQNPPRTIEFWKFLAWVPFPPEPVGDSWKQTQRNSRQSMVFVRADPTMPTKRRPRKTSATCPPPRHFHSI